MVRNKEDEFDKANKIVDMKNKLDYTENERNNLLLNHNQLCNELKKTKNELNNPGNDKRKG